MTSVWASPRQPGLPEHQVNERMVGHRYPRIQRKYIQQRPSVLARWSVPRTRKSNTGRSTRKWIRSSGTCFRPHSIFSEFIAVQSPPSRWFASSRRMNHGAILNKHLWNSSVLPLTGVRLQIEIDLFWWCLDTDAWILVVIQETRKPSPPPLECEFPAVVKWPAQSFIGHWKYPQSGANECPGSTLERCLIRY